jgi:aspartyl-tRNA(Asn)/glutamyl-tRNA(Gln) amidotransferase subunit A
MTAYIDQPLARVAEALRRRDVSSLELVKEALSRHRRSGAALGAYKYMDGEAAQSAAQLADDRLADSSGGPLCGIPVSVKDLYGVGGMPTFAGTARRLPVAWETDAWLVARLRTQGAVFVGKTHTVELAYGAVGINPHWGTPRNPWDGDNARIPGGSSCGAAVSLWEGSALVALGSDTGGSIRIPASMTGTVGHKLTFDRWSVAGVVPLSTSLDTVGALTRSVEDSVYVFGAVDPAWGDPEALLRQLSTLAAAGLRVSVPKCDIWAECQPDIAAVLHAALDDLGTKGWGRLAVDGSLLDEAEHLYMTGGIAGAECRAFLDRDLPGWLQLLHPTVGSRIERAPALDSEMYAASVAERQRLIGRVDTLFQKTDLLVLPAAMITPPLVSELDDLSLYGKTNAAALRPTCPVNLLGLCAITIPVGLDEAGMPVGLQLVAPAGRDEMLLGAALSVERALGTAEQRFGRPPYPPEL